MEFYCYATTHHADSTFVVREKPACLVHGESHAGSGVGQAHILRRFSGDITYASEIITDGREMSSDNRIMDKPIPCLHSFYYS